MRETLSSRRAGLLFGQRVAFGRSSLGESERVRSRRASPKYPARRGQPHSTGLPDRRSRPSCGLDNLETGTRPHPGRASVSNLVKQVLEHPAVRYRGRDLLISKLQIPEDRDVGKQVEVTAETKKGSWVARDVFRP